MEVVTPTVTIPAGQLSANAMVKGVAIGMASITASNPNFAPDTSAVTVTANLNILETSMTLFLGFPKNITIQFESAGSAVAAPAPGISVTMTSSNPGCVSVTSPVTISTGLVNTAATLNYGGTATLPCVTTVIASASDLTSDSISVTVNSAPKIIPYYAPGTVGAGLQKQCYLCFYLETPAPAGGITVHLESSNPSAVRLSPDTTTIGTATIDILVAAGSSFIGSFYIQGVETALLPSTVTITASAPGYTNGSGTATVVQPAFQITSLSTNTTTLSPNTPFYVLVGVPSGGGLSTYQAVRAGGGSPFSHNNKQ